MNETITARNKLQTAGSNAHLHKLTALLRNREGVKRQRARIALVEIGKPAVPSLMECLTDHNNNVRWEAAKALTDIQDPTAAPALVNALRDEIPGVRWLAGEALIKLKSAGLVPLLKGLEKHFDSIWFREGAHHVLHSLAGEDLLNDHVAQVLATLSSGEPGEAAALAAKRALTSLTGR